MVDWLRNTFIHVSVNISGGPCTCWGWVQHLLSPGGITLIPFCGQCKSFICRQNAMPLTFQQATGISFPFFYEDFYLRVDREQICDLNRTDHEYWGKVSVWIQISKSVPYAYFPIINIDWKYRSSTECFQHLVFIEHFQFMRGNRRNFKNTLEYNKKRFHWGGRAGWNKVFLSNSLMEPNWIIIATDCFCLNALNSTNIAIYYADFLETHRLAQCKVA